ncbi:iron complex outermembrane recepter protein [Filimonas lacunae]|uniref:Iron complex outermembrane recepter protein n=1 Tax=Filimonas lacunae TaxID=477680 RepID=A0A173MS91_9BACT|nr:TonB-dependent receptor [Filimonas lacunae]BAV10271.1 TonB-dependent receptor [Filimonas lacunae]SIT17623.1 iron complex outermembrane recepter protein [Filimonas lacunae]
MKRILYLLGLVILCVPGLYAQNATSGKTVAVLSGKVTDATSGNALPGATIFIHELKTGVISQNDGSYTSPKLRPGKYLVEVSYQGYGSVIETINLQQATQENFALKESIVEQEGVTVTGVTSATKTKLSPQPVVIVKRDDLIKTTSTNLIDALSKAVPGVTNIATGPAISKPVIRGLGYNRVVVVNDGMRQEGQQWGDEHGIEIDDYSVQRVEVLKGPASLMYGSDAMGGVVNIQSYTPAPEGTMGVNVLSEYQTNNRLRGVYANVNGTKNGIDWNAYGTYKGAADYQNKYDGRVYNSKFYNKNFGGLLGYTGKWGYSRISASNFDQHIGMVEGERDDATGAFVKADGEIATNADFNKIKPQIPFQHIQHFKTVWDNSIRLGAERLDAIVAYQHNQRREFGESETVPSAYFDLKTINYSLKLQLAERNNWKTSVGVTGMYQTNRNKAEERLIPDYDLFDIGGFVFTQYTKDKLTVSGGVRYDNRHINSLATFDETDLKFASFTKNFSNISGSIGASYAASKQTTFKVNISRGFRAPNMAELASNGAHEGTNRYEVGNTNLKSETSFQVDAGVEVNTEHVSVAASLYYNNIRNFIFYEKMVNGAGADSVIADPSGDLFVYQFDQHNANLYGGEISVDIHPHPLDWLHFENIFSYTRAQFTSEIGGTKNIPFIPAGRLVSELKGNFLPKGKGLRNVYASVESDYNFAQNHAFTGFNTETATGSYWLINAGIGTDIVSRGKKIFSISINGLNLADVAYQNHLSRLKYNPENLATGRMGVFNMGRNFSVKINVPLSFKI